MYVEEVSQADHEDQHEAYHCTYFVSTAFFVLVVLGELCSCLAGVSCCSIVISLQVLNALSLVFNKSLEIRTYEVYVLKLVLNLLKASFSA